ncbi:MAG TPA: RlmE family RNA methyltransferase [Candidatus Absconditabacterales bacterium]|nr:RlmE family RNA methyltransferase [Candidatus Absconditabacterales bacterium]
MIYNPYDHYFNKAKQQGYKARSAFKLEEIQNKFKLIDKNTKTVLDIGCAPGSWMQYTSGLLTTMKVKYFQIIGFDIKESTVNLPNVHTYIQDVTDTEKIDEILNSYNIKQVDFIQSDMAPDTIGNKSIDAMRSIGLLEDTLRIYKKYLKPNGRFAIKIFMGPGFEEFVSELKELFGHKNIKIFKPKSCRSISKETYIVKIA